MSAAPLHAHDSTRLLIGLPGGVILPGRGMRLVSAVCRLLPLTRIRQVQYRRPTGVPAHGRPAGCLRQRCS